MWGFLVSFFVQASIGVPSGGDDKYLIYETPEFRFIFTSDSSDAVAEILTYQKTIHEIYSKEFNWKLNQKENVVLVSERDQMGNASAATTPFLYNLYYRGGADNLDSFASSDWAFSLVSHEAAHSYQINVQAGMPSRTVHSVLGNTLYFPIWIVPIFNYPNLFMPRFFLEGNATWNESRWNRGGRLYSGRIRAIVAALALKQDLTPSQLINETGYFPYGNEKYWLGAEFYRMLEETHRESVNLSFYNHSDSYVVPLLLNKNFRRTFNRYDLEAALVQLSRKIKEESKLHKLSESEPILISKNPVSFSKDASMIRALGTESGSDRPRLIEVNRVSGETQRSTQRLSSGPIWHKNGKFYASAYSSVRPNYRPYGLVDSDGQVLAGSEGTYLFDQNGEHELAFDMRRSWSSRALLLNGKPWGSVRGEPRVSRSGDVWVWEQVGDQRVLKKNQTVLAQFKGFDASMVDVFADEAFFVAPTRTGSSLFSWNAKTQKIERRSTSDGVVEARVLDDQARAVISEAGDQGYRILIVDLSKSLEQPHFEERVSVVKDLSQLPAATEEKRKELQQNSKPYSAWEQWKFSKLDAVLMPFSFYPSGSLQASFLDPLQLHSFEAIYSLGNYGLQSGSLTYINTENLLNWGFLLGAWESATLELSSDSKDFRLVSKNQYHGVAAQVAYRLHTNSYSRSALTLISQYSKDLSHTTNSLTGLTYDYSWTERYLTNLFPYRAYGLRLYGEQSQTDRSFSAVQASMAYDLGAQWVIFLRGNSLQAENRTIDLNPYFQFSNPFVSRTIASNYDDLVMKSQTLEMEFKKVIHRPLLPYTLPFGIRRWVPSGIYKVGLVDGGMRPRDQYVESGYGLGIEFLLNHTVPLYLELNRTWVTGKDPTFQARLQKTFTF